MHKQMEKARGLEY